MRGREIAVDEHLVRAEDHYKIGEVLASAGGVGHEWGAVALFYSAYHLLRHGLRTDPIFQDEQALLRINPELGMRDRNISRHHGRNRRSGKEWGMIELAGLLYRPMVGKYDRLHQASIEVRYGRGRVIPPPAALLEYHAEIQRFHDEGLFRAALHTEG